MVLSVKIALLLGHLFRQREFGTHQGVANRDFRLYMSPEVIREQVRRDQVFANRAIRNTGGADKSSGTASQEV